MNDAREVGKMLAARMPALCAELLPHGQREGREWKAGSVAGERGRSMSVCVSGTKAGLWADFATGHRGDALDLVAAVRCGGDVGEALAWARRWLGISGQRSAVSGQVVAPPPPVADDAAARADVERRRRAALAIYLEAAELTPGDPVDLYLRGRGIDLPRLGRVPRALRYHRRLWCEEAQMRLPAMVAAVCDAAGAHVATHRTWLSQARAASGAVMWRKAPLNSAKKLLGPSRGGCIPLWRGASGVKLADAPEGDVVAIAEGIETALSVALAAPELRVLACVSLGNMAALELPETVATVVLCADNDAGNAAARAALDRAVEHYKAEGRAVRVAMPRDPGADWNDVMARQAMDGVAA